MLSTAYTATFSSRSCFSLHITVKCVGIPASNHNASTTITEYSCTVSSEPEFLHKNAQRGHHSALEMLAPEVIATVHVPHYFPFVCTDRISSDFAEKILGVGTMR